MVSGRQEQGKVYNLCLFGGAIERPAVGDVAMIKELIRTVGTEIPNTEFLILSNKPSTTCKMYSAPNVKAISNKGSNIIKQLSAIKDAHLLIAPGGGSFLNSSSPFDVFTRIGQLLFARIMRKPIILCAMSIHPASIKTGTVRRLIRYFIDRVLIRCFTLYTVRDDLSIKVLRDLGVRKEIILTSDLALNLPPASPQQVNEILSNIGIDKNEPLVVICPRHLIPGLWHAFSEKEIDNLKASLARVADFISAEIGQVLFIPFYTHSPDNDMKVIADIHKYMKRHDDAKSLGYPSSLYHSPYEVAGIIGAANLVIGMRLHSVIFSLINSVPMIAIGYEPKVSQLMEFIGRDDLLCKLETFSYEECIDKIQYALQHHTDIRNELQVKARTLQERSLLNNQIIKESLSMVLKER